jgi:3-oxoacyl-[acyl-carrier protein] reductase
MNSNPILTGKHAVVFGAGGSIGAAVAKQFAAEGAEVFLSGRSKSAVEAVAKEIEANGGRGHAAAIDTFDDAAVNQYIDGIVKQTCKIDIILDAAGPLAKEYGNGRLAVDLPIDQFMVPLDTMVRSRFVTARAAARHMVKQRSGVIILVTGSPARPHVPGATAIGAAFGAIENLTANLAFEVSPFGVRVVCVRTTANIDSRSIQDTMDLLAGQLNITKDQAIAHMAQLNFLKVPATVQDTANAAVLVASDRGRMLTGTVVNATAGAALD